MSDPKWSLCVFCGSSNGNSAVFKEEAYALGKAMAAAEVGLVYGGGDLGVMGAIASGVHDNGGHVIGVIPKSLYNTVSKCPGETIITDTMHERKMIIYEKSRAFLALPGGFGTLDELMEVVTWQQLGIHKKPIAVLNIDGFYDALITMVSTAIGKGFIGEHEGGRLNQFQKASEVLPGFERLFSQELPESRVKWEHDEKSLKLL